ncbi:hypothetical protein TNCV_1125441 [Trichonephila clavipes]|nr:hypothetical protein TNCV_1125441 [Trichonephila clavipes]
MQIQRERLLYTTEHDEMSLDWPSELQTKNRTQETNYNANHVASQDTRSRSKSALTFAEMDPRKSNFYGHL